MSSFIRIITLKKGDISTAAADHERELFKKGTSFNELTKLAEEYLVEELILVLCLIYNSNPTVTVHVKMNPEYFLHFVQQSAERGLYPAFLGTSQEALFRTGISKHDYSLGT